MALNVLAPLLLGGLAKRGIDDYFARRDRGLLSEGLRDALGRSPTTMDPGSADPRLMVGADPGAGLLADPGAVQNQTRFAADVLALPGGSEALPLISQILGFEEAEGRQGALFGHQKRMQDSAHLYDAAKTIYTQGQQNARNQANIDASGVTDPNAPVYGSPGSENARVNIPGIGPVIIPLPGSKAYRDAEQVLGSLETNIGDIDQMIDLIDKHGSESFGPVHGQMQLLYGQVTAGIAKLRDLGVLQEGEAKRLEEQLTNPASIGGAMTSTDTMKAQYEELLRQYQTRLKTRNQMYQYMGLGSQLSQSTPAQIREHQAELERNAQAEAMGLQPIGDVEIDDPGGGQGLSPNPLDWPSGPEMGYGLFQLYRGMVGQ